MDRRQKKTRNAIFSAFIRLMAKREYSSITVQEIIDLADVGRATFYSHFETKDYLLKALCEELFRHVLGDAETHYDCNIGGSFWVHLLRHLKNNDDNILGLLSGRNNEIFLKYFKEALHSTVEKTLPYSENSSGMELPRDYLVSFVSGVFVETVIWWADNKCKLPEETVAEYFFGALSLPLELKNLEARL